MGVVTLPHPLAVDSDDKVTKPVFGVMKYVVGAGEEDTVAM